MFKQKIYNKMLFLLRFARLHNYPTYNKILIIRKQLQKRSCGADEDKGSTFSFT